jgi:hypothetical protein
LGYSLGELFDKLIRSHWLARPRLLRRCKFRSQFAFWQWTPFEKSVDVPINVKPANFVDEPTLKRNWHFFSLWGIKKTQSLLFQKKLLLWSIVKQIVHRHSTYFLSPPSLCLTLSMSISSSDLFSSQAVSKLCTYLW